MYTNIFSFGERILGDYDTRDVGLSNDTRDVGLSNDTRDVWLSNDTRDIGLSNDTRDVGLSNTGVIFLTVVVNSNVLVTRMGFVI